MIIERVEVFGVAIPLVGAFSNAYETTSTQRSVIVRIMTDEGCWGLGNVDPLPGYSVETVDETLHALRTVIGPRLVGSAPVNVHRVLRSMDAAIHAHLDAKAAVEMACMDAAARSCGMPIHSYLGGAVTRKLLLNAWIGMVPPEQAAVEAAEWQQRGFVSAKIKVGGDFQTDLERVRAVREAVGSEFKLRVDANAGYGVDAAVRIARALEPFNLQLFEQPVAADDLRGMRQVRERTGIPIMADESVLDHASLLRVTCLAFVGPFIPGGRLGWDERAGWDAAG